MVQGSGQEGIVSSSALRKVGTMRTTMAELEVILISGADASLGPFDSSLTCEADMK